MKQIQCLVCNKYWDKITRTHLKSHDMTFDDYRQMYPGAKFEALEFTQNRIKHSKEGCVRRFGVDNVMKNEQIKEKAHQGIKDAWKNPNSQYHSQTYRKHWKEMIQSPAVRHKRSEKISEAMQQKYGATSFFATEIAKREIKKILRDKYGVENVMHVPEIAHKMALSRSLRPNNPEQQIINLNIDGLKYVGKNEFPVRISDGHTRYPDFIKQPNKIVEIFGEHYHNEAEAIWLAEEYKKAGYDCLIIWAKEIRHNVGQVKDKIQNFTG